MEKNVHNAHKELFGMWVDWNALLALVVEYLTKRFNCVSVQKISFGLEKAAFNAIYQSILIQRKSNVLIANLVLYMI